MARQTENNARQERRQHVDLVMQEIRAAIASRAIEGPESLHDYRIDELADELEGMRRHLRRTLTREFGRQDGEALEASLFTGDLLSWKAELQELRIDRLARRAVEISQLVEQARAVLPEIEAARQEHWARERAEWAEIHAAREAEFQRRVLEEEPRRLTYEAVVALLKEAGHDGPWYGPIEVPFHAALRHEVITDLELELAKSDYGRDWSFYD
ncbi:hypothetical protein DSM104299_01232 [Baekduia alba]|uniref:hypothetical protein n=1 Tax=Baekduia alba TaxID=2997333 RepID=UPI0023422F4A|nr:hypothetical protein [Baekduia alba]WCB92536.1 hypothetical protein DSM104299_01232 [Baekduia alba]